MSTPSLREAMLDNSRPVFLFGAVPPLEGTTPEKELEIVQKFVARSRTLATDGFLVYDIQEEKGRTADPRPFPYRRCGEPAAFAALLGKVSGKESIVYKCVAELPTHKSYDEWLEKACGQNKQESFNLVGGASSSVSYAGPTVVEAAEKLLKRGNTAFGGVTIAERHTKKGNEHNLLAQKADAGAEWFISQAIYDANAMAKLLLDYGKLCRETGKRPRRVVLTFAPCGRQKTVTFLKWLGVTIPEEVEQRIMGAEKPVLESVNVLCEMLSHILEKTAGCGVPLGISVESVSIFREEIDAAHDLFARLQAQLLDAQGLPWAVRWSVIPAGDKRTSFDGKRPSFALPGKKLVSTIVENEVKPRWQTLQVVAALLFGLTVGKIGGK